MVLEEHVAPVPLLPAVGAFSIRPLPAGGAASCPTRLVLGDPGNAWACSQDESAIRRSGLWLSARPGAHPARARRPGAILPLAMRCEYYENQRRKPFPFRPDPDGRSGAFPEAGWLEQRVAALLEEAGGRRGKAPGPRAPGRPAQTGNDAQARRSA